MGQRIRKRPMFFCFAASSCKAKQPDKVPLKPLQAELRSAGVHPADLPMQIQDFAGEYHLDPTGI